MLFRKLSLALPVSLAALVAVAVFAQTGATNAQGCDEGHWIDEVLADGRIIKLEDGSLWEVDSIDTVTSSIWLPTSDIIVCDDKLINVDDKETVQARRLR